MENGNYIKQEIDKMYEKLKISAATFIYKPDEIEKIKNDIFNLRLNCPHEYKNGKCIYCRKEEDNAH